MQNLDTLIPDETETNPVDLTDAQRDALRDLAATGIEYLNTIPQDTTGLQIYIVGGAVRDALLGREPNDLDFLTVGETVDSMLDRGFIDINASSFGVLHDDNHEEWALARTETKNGDGYKGIDVDTSGVTLEEDLARRDLRMNAMAVHINGDTPRITNENTITTVNTPTSEPSDAYFIDPFNGHRDIKHGELRHVSEAFKEDPVRVLRAARYRARFETPTDSANTAEIIGTADRIPFTINVETKALMRRVAPELNRMSRDRIGEEIVKAMKQAANPAAFWRTLREVGALAVIAQKLDRASIVPAGPEEYHREGDTFTHTMLVLDEMHRHCEAAEITGVDRVRRYMMAIAHDLGKVTLADQQGGLWSDDPPRQFGGHAQTGVSDAAALADSLGLDEHYKCVMQDAAELHMKIHDLPEWDAEMIMEFVDNHTVPDEADTPYTATVDELLALAQADHQGRFQNLPVFNNASEYRSDPGAPDGAARPVFNNRAYDRVVQAARDTIASVDGYEAMRTGLCNTHSSADIQDAELQPTLAACDDCQTPGEWVGDTLTSFRQQQFTMLLTKNP